MYCTYCKWWIDVNRKLSQVFYRRRPQFPSGKRQGSGMKCRARRVRPASSATQLALGLQSLTAWKSCGYILGKWQMVIGAIPPKKIQKDDSRNDGYNMLEFSNDWYMAEIWQVIFLFMGWCSLFMFHHVQWAAAIAIGTAHNNRWGPDPAFIYWSVGMGHCPKY